MKKTYKKYSLGGIAKMYSSPMVQAGGNFQADPISTFEDGGRLETKTQKLVGKTLYIFELGSKKPLEVKILEAKLDPPQFDKRSLRLNFKNGSEEVIKAEYLQDFLKGKAIQLGGKEPYLVSLRSKYNLGGIVNSYTSAGALQFGNPNVIDPATGFPDTFASGGKIKNQYEGKVPSNIWNMLTLEQRQHFLYDHKDQIEAYRGEEYGELTSREIITAYRSDWSELDVNIKNRFMNHVREGEYAGGGKIGFEGLAKKVARRYKGKKVESKYQEEYGKTYDSQEAKEVGRKVAAKVYRQQQAKMDNGGQPYSFEEGDFVYVDNPAWKATMGDKIVRRKIARIFGDDAFFNDGSTSQLKYLSPVPNSLSKKKKEAKISILNEDIDFDENLYEGILSDFDGDGLANADDPNPQQKGDTKSIEQMKFSNTFKKVLQTKDKADDDLDVFIKKMKGSVPSDSKIYGRTKTPFSILNKLVDSRLLDEKRGLKDIVGTTVTFERFSDLENFKNKVNNGIYGKVQEFDDYYAEPKDGYRAYHFIINQNGSPIELQLKTDRMKEINILSHDAYKNKRLNNDYMLYLTNLANNADNGNQTAITEFDKLMEDKHKVEKQLNK